MLMKRVEQQGWHVTHDAPVAALPAAGVDVPLEAVAVSRVK